MRKVALKKNNQVFMFQPKKLQHHSKHKRHLDGDSQNKKVTSTM